MYVTAHLVRSTHGEEAVHAFFHQHGSVLWPDDVVDWPETNPGRLAAQRTVLPLGGHPVHAFLDVLAPDDTPWSAVVLALDALRLHLGDDDEPVVLISGPVTLRFGTDLGPEHDRAAVLADLDAAVTRVLEAT